MADGERRQEPLEIRKGFGGDLRFGQCGSSKREEGSREGETGSERGSGTELLGIMIGSKVMVGSVEEEKELGLRETDQGFTALLNEKGRMLVLVNIGASLLNDLLIEGETLLLNLQGMIELIDPDPLEEIGIRREEKGDGFQTTGFKEGRNGFVLQVAGEDVNLLPNDLPVELLIGEAAQKGSSSRRFFSGIH